MKNLNNKYGIPFASKWKHKDGGEYMVLTIEHAFKDSKIPIVAYAKILDNKDRDYFIKNNIDNIFVRTVEHFKSSFKEIK